MHCFAPAVFLSIVLLPLAAPAQVTMIVDSSQQVKSISPYIYGSNSSVITNRTFDRSGGNRLTGYNWETNASNAGSDFEHYSDYYLTDFVPNLPPGEAVRPMIEAAAAAGRASLVTVPTAGYVSADADGPVTAGQTAPSSRWHEVVPKKNTIYPGVSLSLTPNKNDNYVFTNEFVNWVENTKQAGQPVFYSLDNEPGLWHETHPRIHPSHPTFTELRDKTIAHASAIKDVAPGALVFGGVGYGWNEFTTLQDAPGAVTTPSHPGGDQPGELHYYEWLLQQVTAEEAVQGRTLMDVLDLHWYPEAQGGGQRIVFGGNQTSPAVVAARVQAPRSLWDATYVETSWITQFSTQNTAIALLPRVQRDIDDFKPGTKIAISEYNYGAGDHISGGIAQADVLGIFGREGVFAANWWDLNNGSSYVNAAFNMYLDYDGQGSQFGDTSIFAATSDDALSAVYASVDADDPTRMVLVLINHTNASVMAELSIDHALPLTLAEVYQFTESSSNIVRLDDLVLSVPNALSYNMPAFSVTTLELTSTLTPGDFDGDGDVDGADFVVWQTNFPTANGATLAMGDADGDGDVDGADFVIWQTNFPLTPSSEQAAVPEPTAFLLAMSCIVIVASFARRRTAFRKR